MSATLNKVMLIGRLGKDPELKYAANGTPVTNFTMATDESYTDREGNRVDKAEWHRVVVFSRQAENVANYLRKGSLAYIEGSLQTRDWEDQNGQKRYTTEIKAQRVQFLDPKGRGAEDAPRQSGGGQAQRGGAQQDAGPSSNEDYGPAFPSEASGMDEVPF